MFFVWQRVKRGRRVRARTILRALFPKRILHSRSNEADVGYLIFNVFVYGVMLGWAVLSYQFISNGIISGLVALFGPVSPSNLAGYVTRSVITVMLFLAYELGYWFNHLAQPQGAAAVGIPQVHHNGSAHAAHEFPRAPGLRLGLHQHSCVLGRGRQRFRQLHVRRDGLPVRDVRYEHHPGAVHSRLCAPPAFAHVDRVPRRPGAHLRQPAHHQVHHSANPKHFNKNFGSCLALWDWMFGTLYVPGKNARPLTFGFSGQPDAHTLKGRTGRSVHQCGGPHLAEASEDVSALPIAGASRPG